MATKKRRATKKKSSPKKRTRKTTAVATSRGQKGKDVRRLLAKFKGIVSPAFNEFVKMHPEAANSKARFYTEKKTMVENGELKVGKKKR